MKKLTTIVVFILQHGLTYACPDLQGTYECHSGGPTFMRTIERLEVNSFPVFRVRDPDNTQQIYVDGIERTIRLNGVETQYTASCPSADKLEMAMTQDIGGMGVLNITSVFQLDDQADLVIEAFIVPMIVEKPLKSFCDRL